VKSVVLLGGDWVIKHRGCRRSARGFQAVLEDASISGVILDVPLVLSSLCSIGISISYRDGGDEVMTAMYICFSTFSLPRVEVEVLYRRQSQAKAKKAA
jgi:hypothetical protein